MSKKQSSRIFVIGFIGSDRKGKAMEIAENENFRFIDLDREIEQKDGRSILRMCMMMGEHEYRNKEYEMLQELSSEENIAVACGDGIIFDDMCTEILKENTIVVADSELSCEELWQKAQKSDAPPYAFWLDTDEDRKYRTFCELYESRKPLYQKIDQEGRLMIHQSKDAEKRAAFAVADLMAAAARTAPKGCGADNIEILILDGEDKDRLAAHMREIAGEINADFFNRDAANIDSSHCVVLIGAKDNPLALPNCGLCGFENCGEMKKAGANCTFNITDLGIAVGCAAAAAGDNRIDNRVFYSAGKAAIRMGCFPKDVKVCYGIPLSTSSKSIFFDRDPGAVLV